MVKKKISRIRRLTTWRFEINIMQVGGLILSSTPMFYKIILKTSCRHLTRINNCLATWLAGADYICLTDNLLGCVGEEFSGSSSSEYKSNEEKTVTFINSMKDHNKYQDHDWLIFLDDDAILNKKATEYILPALDKKYVYGIPMRGSWPKDTGLNFPSGGGGYFISPSLISSMSRMPIRGHGQEDVSMGEWLRENNVEIKCDFVLNDKSYPLHLNGWYPLSDLKRKVNVQNDCDLIQYITNKEINFLSRSITHHYIKSIELMSYINNIFNSWTKETLETT